MNKIYMKASFVEEIIDTQKGTIDSNSILTLKDGKKYKLNIAVKFLDKIKEENNFSKLIFSLNDLELRNYLLYSSLGYVHGERMLRHNYLFESEVEAKGETYKVMVGYIGTLLDSNNQTSIEPIDSVSVFRQEHKTINTLISSLKENVNKEKINFSELQTSLNSLFDFLVNHLEKEDLFLYPKLFNSPKLQEINERESKKMEKIHSGFLAYYNKWEDKIKNENFLEFKSETDEMIDVLTTRIEIEEKEIFPSF